jgi:hypothetical protein
MHRNHCSIATLAVVLAATAFFGACGSDSSKSDDTSSGDTSADAGSNSDNTDSDNPDDSGGGDGSGVSEYPDFEQQFWNTGTVHLKLSGDRDDEYDIAGTASSTQGYTGLAFTDEAHTNTIAIGLDKAAGATVSISLGDLITGGTFGGECSLEFTSVDAAALEGTFSCSDMAAVEGTDTFDLNAEATFSLAP